MLIDHQRPVPLSWLDKISLSDDKKALAQRYYDVTCELAERTVGDIFEYQATPGLTNLDEVAQLWWLQAKEGSLTSTLASLPATLVTGVAGVLGGTPIESARTHQGKLAHVSASGHGLNIPLNAASALALAVGIAGVASGFAPLLLAAGLAGPLLTATPLLVQAFGDTNAPVHEMAHAMQFLVLGDLVKRGTLDASDMVAIQNDQGPTGYLWGGDSEAAVRKAEVSGESDALFEVLLERCQQRLEQRYGPESAPRQAEAQAILEDHRDWVKQRLTTKGQA